MLRWIRVTTEMYLDYDLMQRLIVDRMGTDDRTCHGEIVTPLLILDATRLAGVSDETLRRADALLQPARAGAQQVRLYDAARVQAYADSRQRDARA